MPPKKSAKAKRLAASAARGFATTSIIKPKDPEPPADWELADAEPTKAEPPPPSAEQQEPQTVPEPQAPPTQGTPVDSDALLKDALRAEAAADAALAKAAAARAALASSSAVPALAISPRAELALFTHLRDAAPLVGVQTAAAAQPAPLELHQTYVTLQRLGFTDDDIEAGMRSLPSGSVDAIVHLPARFTDKLEHQLGADAPIRSYTQNRGIRSAESGPRYEEPTVAWSEPVGTTKLEDPVDKESSKAWILQRALAGDSGSGGDSDSDSLDESLASYGRNANKLNAGSMQGAKGLTKKQYKQQLQKLEQQRMKQARAQRQQREDAPEAVVNVISNPQDSPDTRPSASIADDLDSWEQVERDADPEPKKETQGDGSLALESHSDSGSEAGGLFESMFDEEAATAASPASALAAVSRHRVHDMSQSGWTGPMPVDLLQQWITKNCKGAQMAFSPLESHRGFRVALRFSGGKGRVKLDGMRFEIPTDEAVTQKLDARQFVATMALYELAGDQQALQIRNLPPKYAELWREWTRAKQAAAHQAAFEARSRRIQFVRDIQQSECAEAPQTAKAHENSVEAVSKADLDQRHRRDAGDDPAKLEQLLEARKKSSKFMRLLSIRSALPVYQHRQAVIDAVSKHQVVVLSGDTGSGKSTQVPQFLLEHAISAGYGTSTNIICTQPRRISAMSLAQRVSEEIADPGQPGARGTWVGYQGVLLRRMESDPLLSGVSHVVVDEVHERTLDSDFLLFLLKRLIPKRPDLRIVLMSATADAAFFAAFFEKNTGIALVPALQVPGKAHPVEIGFLEDAVQQSGYTLDAFSEFALQPKAAGRESRMITVTGRGGKSHRQMVVWEKTLSRADADDLYVDDEEDSAGQDGDAVGAVDRADAGEKAESQPEYSAATLQAVALTNPRRINFELIEHLIYHILATEPPQPQDAGDQPGSILVFLPGMAEIRRVKELLDSRAPDRTKPRLWVLCLHGLLSGQEQSLVFQSAPAGLRKVVLSTNVAETGVTIPDVVYVIDSGRAREVCYDERRKMRKLAEVLISKANCKQRAGRAGRVRPGKCFHLMPRATYDNLMPARPPEMLRLEIEELCLRARSILGPLSRCGPLYQLFEQMPDPPSAQRVQRSLDLLRMTQALDDNENLTQLGTMLANLPLDVRLGKMLLYAAFLDCLEPVLTACAVLSLGKSPFARPLGQEAAAQAAHAAFRRSNSDLLACIAAFDGWRAKLHGTKSRTAARAYCETRFLSLQNLDMINDTREQLRRSLASLGVSGIQAALSASQPVSSVKGQEQRHNTQKQQVDERLLQATLAASLYPNLLVLDPVKRARIDEKPQPGLLHLPGKSDAVVIHRSSLFRLADLSGPQRWFAYYAIQADRVYAGGIAREKPTVLDINEVPGVAVALLCGRTPVANHRIGTLSLDDGRVVLACPSRTCSGLMALRGQLAACFDDFLAGGDSGGAQPTQQVLQVLQAVLHSS
ncbi:hypothetical protein HK105_205982 [Polyrhizophydium stewartii]|uniref:Uncharacterized protein n=1 Tax=Polyrhizophydium stewartii TaxID=2732419 RepID=A0ABR4N4G2_9FUNG